MIPHFCPGERGAEHGNGPPGERGPPANRAREHISTSARNHILLTNNERMICNECNVCAGSSFRRTGTSRATRTRRGGSNLKTGPIPASRATASPFGADCAGRSRVHRGCFPGIGLADHAEPCVNHQRPFMCAGERRNSGRHGRSCGVERAVVSDSAEGCRFQARPGRLTFS
jgi:hypothetical protein